jgi:hypothetical protein
MGTPRLVSTLGLMVSFEKHTTGTLGSPVGAGE